MPDRDGYRLTCAFCGYAYDDPDNHSEELRVHIMECAKHPIAPIIAENKRLKKEYDALLNRPLLCNTCADENKLEGGNACEACGKEL